LWICPQLVLLVSWFARHFVSGSRHHCSWRARLAKRWRCTLCIVIGR